MTDRRRNALVAVVCLGTAVALGACSDEQPADSDRIVLSPPSGGADHTHAPGQGHAEAGPLGDGTTASAGGFLMADVRLPEAGGPGEVSFRILDDARQPVREYVEEQTRDLHLYVVRADLASFRHVHPELGDDGTWRGQVDLGSPGDWRVIAEFTPDGSDRPVLLGETLRVPGAWEPVDAPRGPEALSGDDGVIEAGVVGDAGTVSADGRLELRVSSLAGEPLQLGSYLGTSAHLTGFAVDTGAVVHVHPYGSPEIGKDGTLLTFHTTFEKAADYRMFLQVRVDGLLHQVPVTVPVS